VTFTREPGGIRQSANPVPFQLDGRDYAMARPAATHSWRIAGPHVYECTLKQNGVATATVIRTISDDRNTFTLTSVVAATGSRTTAVWERVGPAVDSEPLIGTWKQIPASLVTDQRMIIEPSPGAVRVLSGVPGRMAVRLEGPLDGKPHAAVTPPNSFHILQQFGPRAFTATTGANKMITSVARYELSSDGQTLTQYTRLVGGLQFLIIYDRDEAVFVPELTQAACIGSASK
jgi:hypothetical protein